jgi:lysophospholipase L1-like esterase
MQFSYAGDGDHAGDTGADGFTSTASSFYYVTELDVENTDAPGSVVAFGDSITNGNSSTENADRRWTDDLARRLRARPARERLGVLNSGISGNRLTHDGAYGQGALIRYRRDILDRAGVRTVVLLEGVNDIRQEPPTGAGELWDGYRRIVDACHAKGLRVLGGTVTPFQGALRWTPGRERIRRQVNARIRGGRLFDGYIDFDAAVRDPGNHARLRPEFQSGDWLHPSDAGYAAMAAAVDLAAL